MLDKWVARHSGVQGASQWCQATCSTSAFRKECTMVKHTITQTVPELANCGGHDPAHRDAWTRGDAQPAVLSHPTSRRLQRKWRRHMHATTPSSPYPSPSPNRCVSAVSTAHPKNEQRNARPQANTKGRLCFSSPKQHHRMFSQRKGLHSHTQHTRTHMRTHNQQPHWSAVQQPSA